MLEYNFKKAMECVVIKKVTLIDTIYDYFVNNKYIEYDGFIEGLKKIVVRIDEENIKRLIKHYINFISVSKGTEMDLIYKFQLYKKDNDVLNMIRVKRKLEKIKEQKEETKKMISDKKCRKSVFESNKDNIIEKIQMIVDDEIEYNDLTTSEKAILRKNVNSFINDISPKTYTKLISKIKRIEPISETDANDAINLIDLKIQEIFYKIFRLSELSSKNNNLDEKMEELSKIHVTGEENLGEFYRKHYCKLRTWKLNKLKRLLDIYKKLIKIYDLVYCPKYLDDFIKLSDEEKETIKLNDESLLELYNKLLKIYNEYTKVSNDKIITELNKEEVKKEYINMNIRSNI